MDSDKSLWQTLISAALVGTERQPFTRPTVAGKLGQLLAQTQPASPEADLLVTAAVISLHQKTGQLPAQIEATRPAPCSQTDLPCCSPQAARCLAKMLQGDYAQVLPEWLKLAAQAGQRVPEFYLPQLLDRHHQAQLQALIAPVLGQRGRWLAAQNPDWRSVVETESELLQNTPINTRSIATAFIAPSNPVNRDVNQIMETIWQTGSQSERWYCLQQLRQQTPDRASALLQATWNQEKAADRAKFLAVLRTNLSLADEPFLESALDDRSQEVRRVAADLLASLPNSRLCERMVERLRPCLKLKNNQLEISLPHTCNEAMMRDGIEPNPPAQLAKVTGKKAWWFQQMVGATPLTFWSKGDWSQAVRSEQLSPAAWINKVASDDLTMMLRGWTQAAIRQSWTGCLDWVRALFDASVEINQLVASTVEHQPLRQLIQHLPAAEYDAFLQRYLAQQPEANQQLFDLLRLSQPTWSLKLSRLVLHSLSRNFPKTNTSFYWGLSAAFRDFALWFAPEITAEIADIRSQFVENALLDKSMNELLDILKFRQEVHQAFIAKT